MSTADTATTPHVPRVLSIAGTDPTGGAGIHADLKSIAANGGYGMAVVTALVAQNTQGVRAVHMPPLEFLREQLAAVSDDVTIDAVKIGMLFDARLVQEVSAWLDAVRPPLVVLDPVMVAASGDRLLGRDAEESVRTLMGQVDLVTPNVPELAVLAQEDSAHSWEDVLGQARRLSARHGVRVLAKGGHLEGSDAHDALVDARTGAVTEAEVVEFTARRIATQHTHGTGCSLSAAVATRRAATTEWADAVDQAKRWLTHSISQARTLDVGRGHGPVSHFADLWERGGTHAPVTPETLARQWWDGIDDVRDAIDHLPFVAGLRDGTVGADEFRWYLEQDALYLREYAKVLAQASVLAPTVDQQAFWARSAHSAMASELELHSSFLPAHELFAATPSDTTRRYTDHLLAASARGDYDLLVAALLPCFWIYWDVGQRMLPHRHTGHAYARWIDTYADPEFTQATTGAISIVSARAASASPVLRRAMEQSFRHSAVLEREFFAAPAQIATARRAQPPVAIVADGDS